MHRTETTFLLALALAVSMTGLANAAITIDPARVQRGLLTAPTTDPAREIGALGRGAYGGDPLSGC